MARQSIERIDSLFDYWRRDARPGAAVAVYREGELFFEGAYGFADIENETPLSVKSVLRLGSTTKHLTATCALILENRGLLALDDDVRRYIPEFPDYGQAITLRHLLSMRSGLRDHLNMLLLAGLDPTSPIGREELFKLALASGPPMYRPGSEFTYSNSNYALMSAVIERLSQQSLYDFMAQELFRPLGMMQTRLTTRLKEIVPGKAKGYSALPDDRFEGAYMLCHVDGAGAVDSTIGDMGKWLLNYRDDKFFGPDYRQRLEARHPDAGPDAFYRLGMEVREYRGREVVRHGGGMHGYACDFAYLPEADIGVIVLANVLDMRIYRVADQIFDILTEAPPSPRGSRSSPSEPTFVEGHFFSEERSVLIALLREGEENALYILGERHPLAPSATGWRSLKRDIELECGGDSVAIDFGAGAPLQMERVDDPRSAPLKTLANADQYAGAYRSVMIGEQHEVVNKEGALEVRLQGMSRSLVWGELRQIRGDLFCAPVEGEPSCTNVLVRFLRDENARVKALRYSFSRCVDCEFERLGPAS